jgi:hypothetical protein
LLNNLLVSYTSDREEGLLQCKKAQEQGAFQRIKVEWILEEMDSTMLSDTVWLQESEIDHIISEKLLQMIYLTNCESGCHYYCHSYRFHFRDLSKF